MSKYPAEMTQSEIAKATNQPAWFVFDVLKKKKAKAIGNSGRPRPGGGLQSTYSSAYVEVVRQIRKEIDARKAAGKTAWTKPRQGTRKMPAAKTALRPAAKTASVGASVAPAKYIIPGTGPLVTTTEIARAAGDSGSGTRDRIEQSGIKPQFENNTTVLYSRADAEIVLTGYAKRAAERRTEAEAHAKRKAAAEKLKAEARVAREAERRAAPSTKALMSRSEVARIAAKARWAKNPVVTPAPAPGITTEDLDALRLYIVDELKRFAVIAAKPAAPAAPADLSHLNTALGNIRTGAENSGAAMTAALRSVNDALNTLSKNLPELITRNTSTSQVSPSDIRGLRSYMSEELATLHKRMMTLDSAANKMQDVAQRVEVLISREEKNHVTLTGVNPKFDELEKSLADVMRMVRGINTRMDYMSVPRVPPPAPAAPPPVVHSMSGMSFNPVLTPQIAAAITPVDAAAGPGTNGETK